MDGSRRRRLRRAVSAVVLAAPALAAAATAWAAHPALNYSSTFNTTSEGWRATDGPKADSMTWVATGGNPEGYIKTTFANGTGTVRSVSGADGGTWKVGNALGDYGGTLAIDVRVHLAASSDDPDLRIGFLTTNASTPACEDLGAPPSSWTTYTVKLTTSHLIDCSSELPLTRAEAAAKLVGFAAVYVAAQNDDNVSETVSVDNAKLAGPQTPAKPPKGSVTRFLTLASGAHKLTGSLLSFDDYSCARKSKVTIFRRGAKSVKVGTVKTRASRTDPARAVFGLKLKGRKKGAYYATVGKSKSSLDRNTCGAAKSTPVRIR